MIIQVNGQNVEVDDSYSHLSPDEQAQTQQEIAQSMGVHQQAQQKQQQQQQQQANPSPMDLANGQSAIRQAIDPAIAVGAVGVPAAMKGYEMYKGASLANSAISALRGAVNPKTIAKESVKVADMASSQAIKDIALQGIQRGVQGAAAFAGSVAPYIRGLSGVALMTHSGNLNNGEDEMIRKMHEQQDQQMQSGAIAPPQGSQPGPVMPQG